MLSAPSPKSPAHRTQRACDQCRQRKARCDGLGHSEKKCSGCLATNRECTYTNFKRKTTRPAHKATPEYVEELEKTIERMRELLVNVKPDLDVLSDLGPSAESTPLSLAHFSKDYLTACLRNIDHTPEPSTLSDDEEDTYVPVEGSKHGVVFGMSSSAHLAKEIAQLRNESVKNYHWHYLNASAWPGLEPEIWMPPELVNETFNTVDIPDKNTILHLINIYFERVNIFWPFLHRPTLEREIVDSTYLNNHIVGAKILMSIAIASQYSDNYKQYWNSGDVQGSPAWRWFYIAQRLRKCSPITLPAVTLDELQFDCLMSFFLAAHQVGHAGWVVCGAGLRMIQCAGSQKRSRYVNTSPLEAEFSKRTVWTLMNVDVLWSAALGRTPMHVPTDIGPSIECDDEFCVEGSCEEGSFKHPADQPSRVAFFNRMAPLMQILSFVLNTVYSARYLKTHLSSNVPDFNQHLVRELDSAMNKWMDAMPAHLRWDPNNDHIVFFTQSAVLHCTFYLVQILIHRPFIPSSNKPSTIPLPSLSICLNAARACCRIAEAHAKRTGFSTPDIQFSIFTCALILLTSMYSKKKAGVNVNMQREMVDVKKCIAILESSEDRWPSSRRLVQVLRDLGSIAPDPVEQSSTPPSSQTTPPNQPTPELNMDGLLTQVWESPTAWDSLFTNLNANMNDPGSQYGLDAIPLYTHDMNAAPILPFEALWQNAGISPGGIGEIFAGTQPMDNFFMDGTQR